MPHAHVPMDDAARPSFLRFLGEAGGLPRRLLFDPVSTEVDGRDGGGRPVLVLPAFLAHDLVCTRLRRTLDAAGYRAHASGIGLNRGLRPDTLDLLVRRVEEVHDASGRPVALVGWCLGGLFAREVAKLRPGLVERVVTMAAPFSGDPRANNVWRLYERVAGHPVDKLPIDVAVAVKPPVPTFALWGVKDGVVSPASARGLPGERDVEMRVECRHTDFVSHPLALRAILEALEEPVYCPAHYL